MEFPFVLTSKMATEEEQSNRNDARDNDPYSRDAINAYVKDQIRLAGDLAEENTIINTKLKQIFKCIVCEEVRRIPIYQCKYGHLICAGCFGDILLESRVQNEIATCPVCQTTINKDLCSRNVAAEKTILLLPRKCKFCNHEFRAHTITQHETEKCYSRLIVCPNFAIGCSWKGTVNASFRHASRCLRSSAVGYDILRGVLLVDDTHKQQIDLHDKLMELLSCEKFTHCDLQFKKCQDEEEKFETHPRYETSTFCALENQWVIRCDIDKSCDLFKYQLVLKTKINNPIGLQYIINKGPYSELDIKPVLYQFKFSDQSMESNYERLPLQNKHNCKNFLSSKRVNFRIFMFLSK